MKSNRTWVLVLATILLFVSCDANGVFDQYLSLEDNTWNLEKPVEFEFQVTDTISKNDVFINIRNNKDYGYSNLFLITHLKFPNGNKIVDTLEYRMTDEKGRFLGSGMSEIKENKLFYKEEKVFSESGNYTLTIRQAMRKNGSVEGIKELKGLTDVGLRIEKTQ